jgi:hypothetical protein
LELRKISNPDSGDSEHEGDAFLVRSPKKRIRCPKCDWEPDGKPYWECEICLILFDTFATRARCPNCDNRWLETQCIRCHRLSAHEAWYES